MNTRRAALMLLLAVMPACATTTTTTLSTSWVDPAAPGYTVRTGRVESVREIVRREVGNPVGGAVAGALIGGFLFGGRGPAALVGAAGGAAIGASASQGVRESRSFQVLVRFDDGTYGMFVYAQFAPFGPGDLVVLTPQGLTHM